jgi:hypothetical protein
MSMNQQITEAAEKIGMDYQAARDLHSYLCRSAEPGAQFAAVQVERAVRLYAEADALMKLLGTLAVPTR